MQTAVSLPAFRNAVQRTLDYQNRSIFNLSSSLVITPLLMSLELFMHIMQHKNEQYARIYDIPQYNFEYYWEFIPGEVTMRSPRFFNLF